MYRDGTGFIFRSSDGRQPVIVWGGAPQDIPVSGDYDGDGETDIAIQTLDRLQAAEEQAQQTALQVRANIEKAVGRRRIAALVMDAHNRGKAPAAVVRAPTPLAANRAATL